MLRSHFKGFQKTEVLNCYKVLEEMLYSSLRKDLAVWCPAGKFVVSGYLNTKRPASTDRPHFVELDNNIHYCFCLIVKTPAGDNLCVTPECRVHMWGLEPRWFAGTV